MRTRPAELSDEDIVAQVDEHWDVDVTAAAYRPVGFGSHHWAVEGGGRRWFVTVDDLPARRWNRREPPGSTFDRLAVALSAARQLADQGLQFVIAPEPSRSGAILLRIDERFALAVYRHVDGAPHQYGDVTPAADRLALLQRLIEVHAAVVHDAREEDLVLPMRDELLTALDEVHERWEGGPLAEPARDLLRQRERWVREALDEHDRMAAHVLEQSGRFVLTHGEPHPGNTMTTADGVVLVDWDTALVGPPERDLWMLAGPERDRTVLSGYADGTGTVVDELALDTYRLHWDLTEIALYTDLLRNPHDDTADNRESLANLRATLEAA